MGRLKVARDEYMAAFAGWTRRTSASPRWGGPAGRQGRGAGAQVDLSQFSLAPVGSDMGQAKAAPAAPPPDTSHLRIQGECPPMKKPADRLFICGVGIPVFGAASAQLAHCPPGLVDGGVGVGAQAASELAMVTLPTWVRARFISFSLSSSSSNRLLAK